MVIAGPFHATSTKYCTWVLIVFGFPEIDILVSRVSMYLNVSYTVDRRALKSINACGLAKGFPSYEFPCKRQWIRTLGSSGAG